MIERILAKLAFYGIDVSEGDDSYTYLEILYDETIQHIASFCNLDADDVGETMQAELSGYISDRIVGAFLYQKNMLGQLAEDITFPDAPVSSIKEGDTSYNFAVSTSDSASAQFTALINQMMNRSDTELLPYRRLKW